MNKIDFHGVKYLYIQLVRYAIYKKKILPKKVKVILLRKMLEFHKKKILTQLLTFNTKIKMQISIDNYLN